MIDFFLSAQRIKWLLAGGGILLAVAVVLLVGAIYLSGQLNTERAEHGVTREKLATAVREGNRWQAAAENAEGKLPALQGAVRECLERETRAAADAVERHSVMETMRPRERSPDEQKEVIDEATRKKAMDRINRPL